MAHETRRNGQPGGPEGAADWHALAADAVCTKLDSPAQGLSPEEARRRLEAWGANELTPQRRRGPWLRFLAQFHNVLIYVLLGAAAVTAALGHGLDTGVILGVVVINALVGFIQEGKAEKALKAIRGLLAPETLVQRGGEQQRIPAAQLVPGDRVVLQAGDRVPADLRLYETHSLRIDEASLTGESAPVLKGEQASVGDAVLAERASMAYAGTLVSHGQGLGVVVATGDRTELGRISGMLREVTTLSTPLLVQLARFGRWLTVAILAGAAATFAFGVLMRGYSAAEMFLAAVGLAVAAIPEGLPAIMTITLAIGVQRMARRHAIIRRLPAVETLGSVTVICSDKTGTLTRNEMSVRAAATAGGSFEVRGVGYAPQGTVTRAGEVLDAAADPMLAALGRAGLLCNDAQLREAAEWEVHGDPTEGALLALAARIGLQVEQERARYTRIDVLPFEPGRQYMATLHGVEAGKGTVIYLKGAPEQVLARCDRQLERAGPAALKPEYWHEQVSAMARGGQRPLAVAEKALAAPGGTLREEDLEGGFVLLGVAGIADPPREDAIASVARCKAAGIRVKMITGDHALTAVAIGRQLGIGDGERVLSGADLDALDADALGEAAHGCDVFARAAPVHKLKLVEALQALGEIVVMTGDGVNDAPALKRSDVGVAMGRKGTEVAKEAAQMVLADDNFASIAHAVEEGRTVYDNLKKSILFILPTSFGEGLMLICAILLGMTLPISPVQVLWVNMITTVTLALALGFEPPETRVMERRPRPRDEPLLSPFLVWRIAFVSLIMVTGTFGLFAWARAHGDSIEHARTLAVNTIVMYEAFYLVNTRYLHASVLSPAGLLGNRYALLAIGVVIGFQLLFTYAGPMQTLFATAPMHADDWVWAVLVALSVFVLVELEKLLLRRSGLLR